MPIVLFIWVSNLNIDVINIRRRRSRAVLKLSLCRWGSPHPPQYNYSLVTAPVALFWADGDLLVVPEDVATLANNLPNLVSLCPSVHQVAALVASDNSDLTISLNVLSVHIMQ